MDCTKCNVCQRWLHHKCVYTKKNKRNVISYTKSFAICSKKCTNSLLPFYNISDKEFLRINKENIKFPCKVCNNECHKKMKRIRCVTCLRWSHLECTFVQNSDKSCVSQEYFCTSKCLMQSLPFHSITNDDKTVFDEQKLLYYINSKHMC